MHPYQEGDLLLYNDRPLKLFGLDYTEFVYVEKGRFKMKDFGEEIEFKTGFYIGKYPVTQQLYKEVMGENPARFQGNYCPVENVSHNDICEGSNSFLVKLNKKIQVDYFELQGKFSLPSEAQWEYAARGGKYWNQPKLIYSGSENLNDVGWYDENSNTHIMPVGLKQPNALGLYDMSGNVWEWCADWKVDGYYHLRDGTPYTKNGTERVLRGGSSFDRTYICRVDFRFSRRPIGRGNYIGFRLAFF